MQYTDIYFPARNVGSIFHSHDVSAKQEVTFFTTEIKNSFGRCPNVSVCVILRVVSETIMIGHFIVQLMQTIIKSLDS